MKISCHLIAYLISILFFGKITLMILVFVYCVLEICLKAEWNVYTVGVFQFVRSIWKMFANRFLFFIYFFNFKSEHKCCKACDNVIADRYLLEVAGHSWHDSCLRCCVCLSVLDEQKTCFIRDKQIYCRQDYMK